MIGALLAAFAMGAAPFPVDELQTPADELARCSGVWEAMSALARTADQPANADMYHQKANGARSASMYFIGLKFNTENPNDQRPLSAWSDYVAGLSDTTETAFLAAAERGDKSTAQHLLLKCGDLLELQQAAIDLLRSARLAPPAGD